MYVPAAAKVIRVGSPEPLLVIEMPELKLVLSILTAVAAPVLPVWSVVLIAER